MRPQISALAAAASLALTTAAGSALAVRPFITDDARVVGERAAQVETWVRVDKNGTQHWLAPAFGPVAPLEVSMIGVHGRDEGKYSASFPILQLKALALETKEGAKIPGLALVGGTVGTGGFGSLRSRKWDTFTYAALSESVLPEDKLLFHQNLGVFVATVDQRRKAQVTWGVGTQVHVLRGFHAVGELFSGDPYESHASGAFQLGGRQFLSRIVQVDATVGRGVFGGGAKLPVWASLGLRIASDTFLF